MLVPLKWINDYVELKGMDGASYGELMTMTGLTLETSRHYGAETENVVVGRINKIEKHPDADKLVICMVDCGKGEDVQIVTGATNVYEGAVVPVALHNSRVPGPLHGQEKVPGGVVITQGKLRGVESFGMLCGPQELGWDDKVAPIDSKDGIWLLRDCGDKIGMDVVEALGLDTDTVDLDVTPNRPDWLSILAVAKDTRAALGAKEGASDPGIKLPETKLKCEGSGKAEDYISAEIRNKACKRYTAHIITDVKIEQSPWWLQHRLMLAGQRPINNIVDITNFVMLEYGQPLHAFDIETVSGRRIIVDVARKGDKFTTLDEKEREMDEDTLMINDAEKAIGIAGIMGGLNSEIEESTRTVILESANFDQDSIRISSRKLGLRTEAANRYIRGIDPNLCMEAAERFCYLVELLGAGKVVPGAVDIYPEPEKAESCRVRFSYLRGLIGADIPKEDIIKYFKLLDFDVKEEGEDSVLCTPPTVRRDMKIEADYAEEAARLYGYERIPETTPQLSLRSEVSESWAMRELVRKELTAMGLNEIQTYSFVSPHAGDPLNLPEDSWEKDFVRILNPLGEETSVMRTMLLPGMMEVLQRNYSRNLPEAKAFEIGNTFMPDFVDPENGKPEEQLSLSIGIYGEGEDFFSLKGRIEKLLEALGIEDAKFTSESEYGAFHPGRAARLSCRDPKAPSESLELGILGELHPDAASGYGIDQKVFAAELNFELLMAASRLEKHYHPLPKFPAIPRDIALVCDDSLPVGDIEDVIKESGGELLESVRLFDVYRGLPIPPGKKSCAFALVYRSAEKTLTDDDIAATHEAVLTALKERTGAVLRDI